MNSKPISVVSGGGGYLIEGTISELNLDNIKDVIAFPKNSNAYDQMLEAPSVANSKELFELGINWDKK